MSFKEDIPPAWQKFLGEDVLSLLPNQKALGHYQPKEVFRALSVLPPDRVKVVLLGMDPYPTKGVPEGLAFSASNNRVIPQSLRNIFKELSSDIGQGEPKDGSLLPWAKEGVLLWNVALTCKPGKAGSHLALWQPFSVALLTKLTDRPFVLLGKDAERVGSLAGVSRAVAAPHPSPLSAWRGFFGSRIFTKTNQLLEESGHSPVNWSLPEKST